MPLFWMIKEKSPKCRGGHLGQASNQATDNKSVGVDAGECCRMAVMFIMDIQTQKTVKQVTDSFMVDFICLGHCCPVNIRQAPLFSKEGLGEI